MFLKVLSIGFLILLASTSVRAQRTWDTLPMVPEHYKARLEKFKKEPVVRGKIVFLGDSQTEYGNWTRLLKDSTIINRGILGDITFGIINRVEEVAVRQPTKLYLLVGINDIAKNIPDEVIMENIFSIVSKVRSISPKTTIIVQSILPTNSSFREFPEHKNKNDHVITINAQLQRYGDRLKYIYLDLYSPFSDSEGNLDVRYTTDGLHLNAVGYSRWADIIKKLN